LEVVSEGGIGGDAPFSGVPPAPSSTNDDDDDEVQIE